MTVAVVVDASAALTLVLQQDGARSARRQLEAWRRAGTSLHVPSHFWLEVVNALLRRHRQPASLALEIVHQLDALGLETDDLSRPVVLLALHHAEAHGLSSYDAAYLALAETLDARLYSADRDLVSAAGPRGIAVKPDSRTLSEQPAQYGFRQPVAWPAYREASAYLSELRSRARKTAAVDS